MLRKIIVIIFAAILIHNFYTHAKDLEHPAPQSLNATLLNESTISLNWEAPDVNDETYLSEDFESGIIDLSEWTLLDLDNDSNLWEIHPYTNAHSGTYSIASYSWLNGNTLTPNNWIISKKINLTANSLLSYWVAAIDDDYCHEHYEIMISTTDNSPDSFSSIFEETLEVGNNQWFERTINLTNYTGQEVYIALVHNETSGQFAIKIDDIRVISQEKNTPQLIGYNIYRSTNNSSFAKINDSTITESFYADNELTPGEYLYKIKAIYDDNIESDYSNSAEIKILESHPTPEPPTLANTQEGVKLSWSHLATNPFIALDEGFEGLALDAIPTGWTKYDFDNDANFWEIHPYTSAHSGINSLASYSWLNGETLYPNNWIITSEIECGMNAKIEYWVAAINATYFEEHYGVYFSTGSLNSDDFTELFSETLEVGDNTWLKREIAVNAQNFRTAFVHNECNGNFALKIDDLKIISSEIKGYNIYRSENNEDNYILLNETLISDTLFIDNAVEENKHYYYKITAKFMDNLESNFSSSTNIIYQSDKIANNNLDKYSIKVYPNPFNPCTTINYNLKNASDVKLEIYNLKGELIKELVNQYQDKGTKSVIWLGKDESGKAAASGIYFYKLRTSHDKITGKILLMK